MRIVILSLFLLAFPALAEPPAPVRIVATPNASTAPAAVTPLDAGKFVFLNIPSYDGPVTWDIDGEKFVSIFPVKAGATLPGFKQGETKAAAHVAPESKSDVLMVFGESAGTVSVAAWGVRDGKPFKLAVLVISVGGARPPPEPKPEPEPKPVPIPAGKLAHWVLVEESSQAPANRGQIVVAAIEFTKSKNLKHTIVDKDVIDPKTGATPADLKAYIDLAKTKTLPQLLLVTKDGELLLQCDAPKDPAAFVAKLKQYAE